MKPSTSLSITIIVVLLEMTSLPLAAQMVSTRTGVEAANRVAITGAPHQVPVRPASAFVRAPRLPSTSAGGASTVSLLSSVPTPSPAESFALSGNYAYVCDDNEISVVNITNRANLQTIGAGVASPFHNTSNIHCGVVGSNLTVFFDQASSTIGNTPGFVAFSLLNPAVPQALTPTAISRRFFEAPAYIGNFAYVPISALVYCCGGHWDAQYGDLLAVDLTNVNAPAVAGALEQPQLSQVYGGGTVVLGAVQADASLIYLGGSASTSNLNNGNGRLQVVDVSTPASMKIIAQLAIPNSIHFWAPIIQGTIAVGIGNTGGYGNNGEGATGNIVVTTFDVSDRRSPSVLSNTVTTYKVGPGGGRTRIGNNLFAFGGVIDANTNNVLLVVDASNPTAPVLSSFPISSPFTDMQAVGNTLYATLGSGGFASYSIPGVGTVPATCPASTDVVLTVDRGATVSPQAFLDGKAALQTFVDSLHLTPDQAAVASFTNTATVSQTLTVNGTLAKTALTAITSGGSSYIGAGIAAAQAELTGARHNASATPIMIVLSDGADLAAPNASATMTAANAAKAAGIRIISIQIGSATGTLMQSIASSNSDYYLVAQ